MLLQKVIVLVNRQLNDAAQLIQLLTYSMEQSPS